MARTPWQGPLGETSARTPQQGGFDEEAPERRLRRKCAGKEALARRTHRGCLIEEASERRLWRQKHLKSLWKKDKDGAWTMDVDIRFTEEVDDGSD